MNTGRPDNRKAMKRLQEAFEQGARAAQEALRKMMRRELDFTVSGVQEVPFEQVCNFRYPADVPVAMIVLRLLGEGEGYLVFVMFEESAKKVNQILWEEVPECSEVLNLSSISAIKEMGNVVGSCFLNRLADSSGIELRPGEPMFVYDLMEAMMEALLIEQSLSSDRAIIVDTIIKNPQEGIAFDILFLPSGGLLNRLIEGLSENDRAD